MKKPLRNLIAMLMSGCLLQKTGTRQSAEIEEGLVPQLQTVFHALISERELDNETNFLLRRLAAFLPLGGNAKLIDRIKKGAEDLSKESGGKLENLRQKIHNYFGREDVDIVYAYNLFLKTGSIDKFRALCTKHRIELNFNQLSQDRSVLRETTSILTKTLLSNLEKFWKFKHSDFGKINERLEANISELEGELKIIAKDLIRGLSQLDKYLKSNQRKRIASLVGNLRFDARVLERKTTGELQKEFYFLDIFLESVETQVHYDLIKQIQIRTWQDVTGLIGMIIQKTLSLGAIYHTDPSLIKGVDWLKKFRKTKHLGDLGNATYYLNAGVSYLNEKMAKEFKKIFKSRNIAGEQKLEELVSPFTRTGAIYQLSELIATLEKANLPNKKTGKNILQEIIKTTPRPVTTHLRERILERAGISSDKPNSQRERRAA